MSELLFYQKVAKLNSDKHRNLRISDSPDYQFAARTNSVPLVAGEFFDAAKDYPIFFAGDDAVPIALLGTSNDENLFIRADGGWDANYIPAFVRRYPFAPAQGQSEEGEVIVCIDEASDKLSETDGEPLFDEQGGPTERLQGALDLLKAYQQEWQRTQRFLSWLDTHGLLREASASLQYANGQPFRIPGLRIVDEQALLALPDEVALEVFRSGELGWIYAHLASLGNLTRLVRRQPSGVDETVQ